MNRRRLNLNTGSGIATMLMIFVVLSMTIVSLITYLEALKNMKAADREVEYTKKYYCAYENAINKLEDGEDDMIIEEELFDNSKLVMERKDGVITYRILEG